MLGSPPWGPSQSCQQAAVSVQIRWVLNQLPTGHLLTPVVRVAQQRALPPQAVWRDWRPWRRERSPRSQVRGCDHWSIRRCDSSGCASRQSKCYGAVVARNARRPGPLPRRLCLFPSRFQVPRSARKCQPTNGPAAWQEQDLPRAWGLLLVRLSLGAPLSSVRRRRRCAPGRRSHGTSGNSSRPRRPILCGRSSIP